MKNLKKILVISLIIGAINNLIILQANYQPTIKDELLLNSIYNKIDKIFIVDKKKTVTISEKLSLIIETTKLNQRNYYILNEFHKYLLTKLSYVETSENKQNNDIEIENKNISLTGNNYKINFFENYGLEILSDMSSINPCLKKYQIIDEIGKNNNFPTPLIIATWWMETTCKLNNPPNGYGLFQLRGFNYGTGPVNDIDFKKQIEDFIAFSKNKRNRQNKSKIAGNHIIDINYDKYDIESLKYHGYLYNGMKKGTSPQTSMFNNGNLNENFKNNKDGLITVFLKTLKREIDNNK